MKASASRFLEVAVRQGYLTRSTQQSVLRNQQDLSRAGHRRQCGEICVTHGHLTESQRENVLAIQRSHGEQFHHRASTHPPELPWFVQPMAWIAAGGAGLTWYFTEHTDIGIVASVVATAVGLFLGLALLVQGRSVRRAIQGTLRSLPMILVPVALAFLASRVADNTSTITRALWVLSIVTIVVLFANVRWKFAFLRMMQARTTVIKDTYLQVDGNGSHPGNETATIDTVLRGIRATLELHPTVLVLRRHFPQKCATTVLYLTPDPATQSFVVSGTAFPKDAPDNVREMVTWMNTHHRPAFLDQQGFDQLVERAKREDRKQWRRRLISYADRHRYISATGYTYAKKRILCENHPDRCLAWDTSYLDDAADGGFATCLPWITAGAFLTCPIGNVTRTPTGVLLVIRSGPIPISHEDREWVILGSRILSKLVEGGSK